jgi:hypothetical protein
MIVVECGDGRAVADTMVRKDDDMVPSCDDNDDDDVVVQRKDTNVERYVLDVLGSI